MDLPDKRYSPGEFLRAADFNRLADAVAVLVERRLEARFQRAGMLAQDPGVLIQVQNDTGETLYPRYIAGLADHVYKEEERFLLEPVLVRVITPEIGYASAGNCKEHVGHWCIIADEIPHHGIGPAWVSGVVLVKVNVIQAYHDWAEVKNMEIEYLESRPIGTARILWKESGTGVKWALVKFPAFAFPPIFEATAAASGGNITAKPVQANGDLVDEESTFSVLSE